MTDMPKRCAAAVMRSPGLVQDCPEAATVTEDGRDWCLWHAPSHWERYHDEKANQRRDWLA